MAKYKIVIDLLGSDKGPEEILKGAALSLEAFPELSLILVGPEDLIKASNLPLDRVEIINCDKTVTNYDNSVDAFYKATDVSIFKALEATAKSDAIGMINAGNTGAMLVGCIKYLLTEKRTRPCLCAVMPTVTKSFTCLVDTGASIDCGPHQLVEFAHLGSEFMKKLLGIESPRVGLLSNGSEPTKGNKLVKEAHHLLAEEEGINFVGNIEGNNALSGQCEVLVAEGFAGNQVLKNSEGMAMNLITEIVKYGKKTGKEAEVMEIVGYLMQRFDFESLGAGIVLGIRKPVMKCRGSSGAKAIKNAVKMMINLSEEKSLYEDR